MMKTGTHIVLGVLLSISIVCCSQHYSRELVGLPLRVDAGDRLDSAQSVAVFNFARGCPNGTQISLCIITGDSEKYTGILRRNDSLVYMVNCDSVFEIGSITKTFTGTMLASLIYDGRVDLNAPITKFLPVRMRQSSLGGIEITLAHLANHTSGLPFEPGNVRGNPDHPFDPYSPYRYYTLPMLYDYLSGQLSLQSTPGEKRVYSNLGGGLLGHILTLISGKPYEDLLFETVCDPLGMKSTFVTLNDERARRIVRGRDPRGVPLPLDGGACGALTGAGGIHSTVRDLVKYLRANMDDTTYLLLAQTPTKRFDEHFTGGLGWGTYSDGGNHHVGAFGATGGYTSGVIFERTKRVGVVVLTNVSAFTTPPEHNAERLCRDLYDPLPFATAR